MHTIFFAGPDKKSFYLNEGKGLVSPTGNVPFHGIISRGMLQHFSQNGWSVADWHQFALVFEQHVGHMPIENKFLLSVFKCAEEEGVLRFWQSALAVQRYLEGMRQPEDGDCIYECWNIKEGHTSSVWRIEMKDACGQVQRFVLNVGRDIAASIELTSLSQHMVALAETEATLPMAKVLDIITLSDPDLPEITITKNEWIEQSFELHTRHNRGSGQQEWLMVERFITADDRPSHIQSVLGRLLSATESDRLRKQLDQFYAVAQHRAGFRPELNINHGDVVWCPDRQQAVVIAIS